MHNDGDQQGSHIWSYRLGIEVDTSLCYCQLLHSISRASMTVICVTARLNIDDNSTIFHFSWLRLATCSILREPNVRRLSFPTTKLPNHVIYYSQRRERDQEKTAEHFPDADAANPQPFGQRPQGQECYQVSGSRVYAHPGDVHGTKGQSSLQPVAIASQNPLRSRQVLELI